MENYEPPSESFSPDTSAATTSTEPVIGSKVKMLIGLELLGNDELMTILYILAYIVAIFIGSWIVSVIL